MWTTTVVIATLASFVLLAEATYDDSPVYPPSIDTTITCMVAGDYRNKRSSSPPDRVPRPEDTLELQLTVGQIDEYWELPLVNVKEPGIPDYSDDDFSGALDAFLNPTDAERLVALNVRFMTAPNPNPLFNKTIQPFEIPAELLEGLSQTDRNTITQYVNAADIGDCAPIYEWRERPPFYFPRFQVYGRCDGRDDCAIPITNDHAFSQRCRPDLSDYIRIRALRWDCCHSYTEDNTWENICGWRVVSVPIVNRCTCMCDPNEG